MLRFILRRLFVSIFILFGALFIVYNLAAMSKNPLHDLLQSTAPNKQQLIEARIEMLDLDVPAPARFFLWLGGVLRGDMGVNVLGEDVGPILEGAVAQTLQLVTAATLLAMIIGVAIGISTALRQYSGYDYTVTFLAFLVYSLPIFFIAVLMKQYLAIAFNDFLKDPQIPVPWLLLIGLIMGFIAMSVIGGPLRKRAITFAAVGAGSILILVVMQLADWFRNPGLGPVLIGVLGAVVAIIAAALTVSLSHRRNLAVTLAVALSGALLWLPLQYAMTNQIGAWFPIVLIAGYTVAAWAAGHFLGGIDRTAVRSNAAVAGFTIAVLLILDRVMQVWNAYYEQTGGRPIATVGASSTQLGKNPSIWLQMLDGYTHLLLPTLAIMLISVASYSRYSRASLLEIMNQDYIRTARAKGLPERTVITRHALRNSLIPVTTIVAADVGAIIGGAIVTEEIFAWRAMGTLFAESLRNVDLNPLMGYMLVTAALTVVFNLVADIAYSLLDPRIRLS